MAEQPQRALDDTKTACSLVYKSACNAGLESVSLQTFSDESVHIKTLYSAISRGTERLVFQGKIPRSQWQIMRCPNQMGDFSFPLSYGYCLVGKVIETGDKVTSLSKNDIVFALHPHQDRLVLQARNVQKIPRSLPTRRAVLSANMETALNAVWDGDLRANDRVCVIGCGVVGLLTGYVCAQYSNEPVTLVDTNPVRREIVNKLGLIFALPDDVNTEFDIVFHTSATSKGLQSAIDMLSFEGRVIEMSWYGDDRTSLNLGGAFHSKRLQIISSQVGHISPTRRAELSYQHRMAQAMKLLEDNALDHLIEPPIAFKALPEKLLDIFSPNCAILCQLIDYGE